MCVIYGACRVSTRKQSIDRQIRNIKDIYPEAVIIKEAYTGRKINRPVFEALLKKVKPGDTIVFDEVSRMCRNEKEGFQTYKDLYSRGINLVFLKEPHINTAVYKTALERQIQLAVSTGNQATDDLINAIADAINKYAMTLLEEQIKLAFRQAQHEVEFLSMRTKEGQQTAVLNGKTIGIEKGRKLTIKKEAPAKELILKHNIDFGGTLNDIETMKIVGVSRGTYYKYKRELREQD